MNSFVKKTLPMLEERSTPVTLLQAPLISGVSLSRRTAHLSEVQNQHRKWSKSLPITRAWKLTEWLWEGVTLACLVWSCFPASLTSSGLSSSPHRPKDTAAAFPRSRLHTLLGGELLPPFLLWRGLQALQFPLPRYPQRHWQGLLVAD